MWNEYYPIVFSAFLFFFPNDYFLAVTDRMRFVNQWVNFGSKNVDRFSSPRRREFEKIEMKLHLIGKITIDFYKNRQLKLMTIIMNICSKRPRELGAPAGVIWWQRTLLYYLIEKNKNEKKWLYDGNENFSPISSLFFSFLLSRLQHLRSCFTVARTRGRWRVLTTKWLSLVGLRLLKGPRGKGEREGWGLREIIWSLVVRFLTIAQAGHDWATEDRNFLGKLPSSLYDIILINFYHHNNHKKKFSNVVENL